MSKTPGLTHAISGRSPAEIASHAKRNFEDPRLSLRKPEVGDRVALDGLGEAVITTPGVGAAKTEFVGPGAVRSGTVEQVHEGGYTVALDAPKGSQYEGKSVFLMDENVVGVKLG